MLRWAVCEAIQRQPAGARPRQVKDGIIARRGAEEEHRQGRCRSRAAHPALLRHARRAHPPRHPPGTGRMTWTGPAAGREAVQRTAPRRAPAAAGPAARAPA